MMRSSLLALDQTADVGVSVTAEICDTVDGSRPWLGGRDLNPDMLVQSQLSYR